MRTNSWMRAVWMLAVIALSAGAQAADEIDLSETPIPFLKSEDLPPRVGALIELGRGINEIGELSPGIEMPGGAVWQPALWVYGTTRTHALTADRPRRAPGQGLPGLPPQSQDSRSEIVTRLDLFANLQLAGTERIFAHVRPLDAPGEFTGQRYDPDNDFELSTDFDFESFFFEGDFDEMFPNLDPDDRKEHDIGIALGRFPVEFQNGYLVRDEITSIGLAKTLVQFPGASGMRIAGIWGFDHVNTTASNAEHDDDTDLYGLFIEGDFPWGLLELDIATTRSDAVGNNGARGDQLNYGISWVGHSAGRNYSVHANVSRQDDATRVDDSGGTAEIVSDDFDGKLLVLGYSDEINLNHDLFYANAFWVDGFFHRLASNATPVLGPVGLSFAGVGMGQYTPALSPLARDAVGVAFGVQKFFGDELTNWALEFAYRDDDRPNAADDNGGHAITTRLQHKFANRFLVQMDAYHAWHQFANPSGDDESSALRVEVRMNF